jgi:hypothetical protein
MVTNFSKKPPKEGITDDELMWERNMKTETWYVRSLFWSGVLHNELSNLGFDVVALQETQLESGIRTFDNFALFNSGLESKKHKFGFGFYVYLSGGFLKCVKDFKIINERIMLLENKI